MISNRELQRGLKNINWDNYNIDPKEGDCVSVAVGISRVVGVDKFIGVFDIVSEDKPLHLVVVREGELFDGEGFLGNNPEVLLDFLDFLRVRDFPAGVNTPEEIYEYEMAQCIVSFEEVEGVVVRSMDKQVVNKVVTVLEEKIG